MPRFLFGGTFDPPHRGHSTIVTTLLTLADDESGDRDTESTVTVIPSFNPPAKNPPLFGYEQRMALCHRAFLPLDQRVAVSAIESQLPPPSYFINTVHALSGDGDKPVMVIGFDQLLSLHLWHKAEELFASVDIWVMDRHADDGVREAIVTQLSRFDGGAIPDGWRVTQPLDHPKGQFRYVPFDQPQSSTAIREQLTAGRLAQVKDWLDPEVYALLNDPDFYPREGGSWKPPH